MAYGVRRRGWLADVAICGAGSFFPGGRKFGCPKDFVVGALRTLFGGARRTLFGGARRTLVGGARRPGSHLLLNAAVFRGRVRACAHVAARACTRAREALKPLYENGVRGFKASVPIRYCAGTGTQVCGGARRPVFWGARRTLFGGARRTLFGSARRTLCWMVGL